jgi:hypothetical protein
VNTCPPSESEASQAQFEELNEHPPLPQLPEKYCVSPLPSPHLFVPLHVLLSEQVLKLQVPVAARQVGE